MIKFHYYLVLGSKKDAKCLIEITIQKILEVANIIKFSPVFEAEEEDSNSGIIYWNMCLFLSSKMFPEEIKSKLKEIEQIVNTNQKTKIIDLDLLYCIELNSENLNLPHPDLTKMKHLFFPLSKIDPKLCPNNDGISIQDICNNHKTSFEFKDINWLPYVK